MQLYGHYAFYRRLNINLSVIEQFLSFSYTVSVMEFLLFMIEDFLYIKQVHI